MAANRITVFDAWRGVSIIAVIGGHLVVSRFHDRIADGSLASLRDGPPDVVAIAKALAWRLGESGAVFGLSVFFVVSGVLITTILAHDAGDGVRRLLRGFYVRRICRIVPPLAVLLVASYALWRAGQLATTPEAFAYAATFTCDVVHRCGWTFAHLWSVSLEEQFYLAWPVVFLAWPRRRASVARVLVLAALVTLASGAPAGRDLALGVACIVLGSLHVVDPQVRKIVERVACGATTIAGCGVFVARAFAPRDGALDTLLATVSPLAVYLVVVESLRPSSVARAAIDRPWFRAAGAVSYSAYLWQQMFTQPFADDSVSVLRWLVLLIPVTWLSWRFVERPFIALGRSWSRRDARRSARASGDAVPPPGWSSSG